MCRVGALGRPGGSWDRPGNRRGPGQLGVPGECCLRPGIAHSHGPRRAACRLAGRRSGGPMTRAGLLLCPLDGAPRACTTSHLNHGSFQHLAAPSSCSAHLAALPCSCAVQVASSGAPRRPVWWGGEAGGQWPPAAACTRVYSSLTSATHAALPPCREPPVAARPPQQAHPLQRLRHTLQVGPPAAGRGAGVPAASATGVPILHAVAMRTL